MGKICKMTLVLSRIQHGSGLRYEEGDRRCVAWWGSRRRSVEPLASEVFVRGLESRQAN